MGEVYSATDTRLNRSVAVKILPAHLTAELSNGEDSYGASLSKLEELLQLKSEAQELKAKLEQAKLDKASK